MPQYSLIDLNDSEAVRGFAYKGKHGMAEDEVKSAMKSTLEGRGYEVHVKWGKKSGSDIVAIIVGNRLVIEAKGEGAYRQMLGNYFLSALRRNASKDDRGHRIVWCRLSCPFESCRTCIETAQASPGSFALGFLFRKADRNHA